MGVVVNSQTIEGTGHKLAHFKHRLCLLSGDKKRPGDQAQQKPVGHVKTPLTLHP